MKNRLKEILFKAHKRVYSTNTGENLTKFRGDGMDLRDIKEYNYGDDIRHINWKATAKSDTLQVNIFDDYKELNILTVFLNSATIAFGSQEIKQDVMAQTLSYIVSSSLKNRDNLKSIFFSTKCEKDFPLVKNRTILSEVIKYSLESDSTQRELDYFALCNYINEHYKSPHIVVFIGDFLSQPDFSKLSTKHQTYAVVIRDHLEENLSFDNEVEIRSPFTLSDEKFYITPAVKSRYKELINQHDKTLFRHLNEYKISATKIYSDDDIYHKLLGLFR